jgi:choline dehydrogenase-like flavoprotein
MLSENLAALAIPESGFDVCIIGSGAAGISLACELDGSGLKVLLLEAGGFEHAAKGTERYQGSANAPHPDPTQYRRGNLGGTTSIWGGRCVPYEPIDFEARDYLPNSGWPLPYQAVADYYPRAMAYCDAGKADFTVAGSLSHHKPIVPGLANDALLVTDALERYSLPTHFGSRYRQKLTASSNVTVVLNSRCLKLNADAGKIASIEVLGAEGQSQTLAARTFVLATGGIETARLMLASGGIGNGHDLVGRYYACHFENVLGRLVTTGKDVQFDFEKTTDGIYCRRKLQFQPEAMRQHQLLNTSFRLHFPNYSDASHRNAVMSAIFLVKSILIAEYRAILRHGTEDGDASPRWQHLRNVVLGVPQLFRFAWVWLTGRVLATRKLPYTLQPNADGSYPLEFNCEQTPRPESRVNVHWLLDADDVARACKGFRLLRDDINRIPGLRLEFDDATLPAQMARCVPLGGHHIGTARMAASPETGVVNTDCAVFDAPNLYIASSAVFPTSSNANPTLTIVALAVRLADHLKQALKAR